MRDNGLVISILGSAGGVAKSVLSLLNKTAADPCDPLHLLINRSKLHFIDMNQKNIDYYKQICSNLINRISLYQFDLENRERVCKHLSDTGTTLIIDLSWADTVEMLDICNDLGISYVNTALENVEVENDESINGFTLMERYKRFETARDKFTNMKGIVCSGMNPGVVQWMVHSMMNDYPEEKPLACYIVEKDSTFYKDKSLIQKDTMYSTWSPECYLDEAILNYPVFVKQNVPLHFYTPVYSQEFKVALGNTEFYGSLVPHEEVLSLGKLYDFEIGFIYKVNEYTTKIIRDNLDQTDYLWNLQYKVLDPAEAQLEGEDLVGVLMVYKDKERFMYNVMDSQTTFLHFKTNATYLQVACGVYAAVCTLLLDAVPKGIYFVDELLKTFESTDYGKYVSQYMCEFVKGENVRSDGLLLDRMRKA